MAHLYSQCFTTLTLAGVVCKRICVFILLMLVYVIIRGVFLHPEISMIFYWPKLSRGLTVYWGCLGPFIQHRSLCLTCLSVCLGPCGTHPMWALWNRDSIFCYFLKLLNPAPKTHGPSFCVGHLGYFFNYLGFLTERLCNIWKAFFSLWSWEYFHCTAAILDLASWLLHMQTRCATWQIVWCCRPLHQS